MLIYDGSGATVAYAFYPRRLSCAQLDYTDGKVRTQYGPRARLRAGRAPPGHAGGWPPARRGGQRLPAGARVEANGS